MFYILKYLNIQIRKKSGEAVGVGGIYNFLVPELNDIYSGIKYKQPWKQKVVENILLF